MYDQFFPLLGPVIQSFGDISLKIFLTNSLVVGDFRGHDSHVTSL